VRLFVISESWAGHSVRQFIQHETDQSDYNGVVFSGDDA